MSSYTNDTDITDIDIDPCLRDSSTSLPTNDKSGRSQEAGTTTVHEWIYGTSETTKDHTNNTSNTHEPTQNTSRTNEPLGLMSLLSGNQNKRNKKKKKTQKEPRQPEHPKQGESHTKELETDCDVSDSFDTSFTETKSKQLRNDYDVLELEKKIYNNEVESVSAKDFFSRLKKKPEPVKVPMSTETNLHEVITQNAQNSNEPIFIDLEEDKVVVLDTKDLESKVFGDNPKRTSAKELLKSLRSDPKRPKTPTKSFLITLKVNPSALKEISNFDNPFKTKGNSSFQGASKLGLKGNDFFDAPKIAKKSSSSNSFFDSMMKASRESVKPTPLQKLKELEPPIINRSLFHVTEKDGLTWHNDILSCLPSRVYNKRMDARDQIFEHVNKKFEIPRLLTVQKNISKLNLLHQRMPEYYKYQELDAIVKKFLPASTSEDDELEVTENTNLTSQLWTDLFHPETTKQLLISKDTRNDIRSWIKNSFSRLKAQSLKNPRNVLLKQKKRKQKNEDSFIVDDFSVDYEDEETEEEIFMPLLILQGSIGSGKSSSVYTVTKELNSYVHEINTGSNRGRKDIFNSLKEFCTTQLVHQQGESRTFQQGIVLLEDVNVLFEQDKSFWTVVQDILNISRRPMVLTCETLLNIPKSLLELANEERSIIHMDQSPISHQLLKSYIWICALTQGYDIKSGLLEKIIRECSNGFNYDLRKCLMETQIICQSNQRQDAENITEISLPGRPQKQDITDLESYGNLMDSLSNAEVIANGYTSNLNHKVQENELIDIYHIDETTRISQDPLPFELNIGGHLIDAIENQFNIQTSSPSSRFTYNTIKNEITSFIGSRSKKRPKFLQELVSVTRTTRSQNSEFGGESPDPQGWTNEITGIPDTSFLNYITLNSLILDVLPLCRNWIGFQKELDKIEQTTRASGGASVKEFISYREFQKDARILLDTLTRYSI